MGEVIELVKSRGRLCVILSASDNRLVTDIKKMLAGVRDWCMRKLDINIATLGTKVIKGHLAE